LKMVLNTIKKTNNYIHSIKLRVKMLLLQPWLLVMKIHVPILNKMKSTSLEVYNWHQFVIIITFSDNVCPYLVLYTFNQAESEDAVAAALHFNGRRSLRAPFSLVWSSWILIVLMGGHSFFV
jgi:hypothetical protein